MLVELGDFYSPVFCSLCFTWGFINEVVSPLIVTVHTPFEGCFLSVGEKSFFFKRIVKKPFINTAKLYRVIDSILIWFTIAFLFLGGV